MDTGWNACSQAQMAAPRSLNTILRSELREQLENCRQELKKIPVYVNAQ